MGLATLLLTACLAVPWQQHQVTTKSLVAETLDLARLARLPPAAYHTIQFSSYDRSSTTRDGPGWFANSDGFGRERIPGFLRVLREPNAGGVGLYLVADVEGPGAIVRGWTAGMGGTMRVYLDRSPRPVFEGSAETFLRRRTQWFLDKLGVGRENGLTQEDADYLPIPFAQHLRITWEGRIRDLHFYQLQVRRYEPGTSVRTFARSDANTAIAQVVVEYRDLRTVIAGLQIGPRYELPSNLIEPAETWAWRTPLARAGKVVELRLQIRAKDLMTTLRRTRLRIRFDDASIPQVDAPFGDFFATGPGVHPYESLPFTVESEGWMTCRFHMPFRKSCTLLVTNGNAYPIVIGGEIALAHDEWEPDSLYFHAKWRADHDLVADGREVVDLPYVVILGKGRLVGVACMLMNPSGIPTPGGNWWGEGDEKVFVDGESTPSTFGTGSEDYYNYSWSRPGLFAHPYCGQPLCSGPGTSGYVSNHRFQILDDIPFQRSLAFFMELKHHRRTPGLSYARIAYWYAAPGSVDDHRALMPSDLIVPELPERRPVADGGARGATFVFFRDLAAEGPDLRTVEAPLAPSHEIRAWNAEQGDELRTTIDLPDAGPWAFRVVAAHRPDAGAFRLKVGGKTLNVRASDSPTASLKTAHQTRFQNVYWEPVDAEKGANDVVIECVEAGFLGFDYFWIQPGARPPMKVPGALEAEDLEIVAKSDGLETERQDMNGRRWSNGRHLWVKANEDGAFVELKVPVKEPGRYRVAVRLTKSWDYGIVALSIDGKPIGQPIDTFNAGRRAVDLVPIAELGAHDVGEAFRLRFTVKGAHERSEPPGRYFGIDWVRLTPAR